MVAGMTFVNVSAILTKSLDKVRFVLTYIL